MLKQPTPVADLSLTDIRGLVDHNKTTEQISLRERQDAARAHQAHRTAETSVVRALAAELATDLGAASGALVTRLVAIAPARHGATADRTMGPLWRPLLLLAGHEADADPQTARESRHVLAATGDLPKVRKGSAFGDVAQLRTLPSAQLGRPKVYEHWLEDVIAPAIGLEWPAPTSNKLEAPRDAWERTRSQHHRGDYGPDARTSLALADREYALICEVFKAEADRIAAQYATDAIAARARVLAVVDAALGTMPIGPAWGWTRELRRHVAGERPRIESEFARVWATCLALGVRLSLDGGAS